MVTAFFAKREIMKEDTIVALATPPGRGAIAVVRMSGGRCKRDRRPRYLTKRKKLKARCDGPGRHSLPPAVCLDDVMAVYICRAQFPIPAEDSVEITCHGSAWGVYDIIKALTDNGARPAQPVNLPRRALFEREDGSVPGRGGMRFYCSILPGGGRTQAQMQLQGALKLAVTGFQVRWAILSRSVEAAVEYPEEDLGIFDPAKSRARTLRSCFQIYKISQNPTIRQGY